MYNLLVHLPPARRNEILSEHMEEAIPGKLIFVFIVIDVILGKLGYSFVFAPDVIVLFNIIFHSSDMVL
jgi:hypothetical protein